MKTVKIPSQTGTFKALAAETHYVLDADDAIILNKDNGWGIKADNQAENRSFTINGDIKVQGTGSRGIEIGEMTTHNGGADLTIGKASMIYAELGVINNADGSHITNHGSVFGTFGIGTTGGNVRIDNDGAISGAKNGVYSALGSTLINNDGAISGGEVGAYLVVMAGDSVRLVNDGTVDGGQAGVGVLSPGGGSVRIVNHGEISGPVAFTSGTSVTRDVIRNTGTMSGEVKMGAGNDRYDGRGGQSGKVDGGAGDDTYLITDKTTILVEGLDGGTDTVAVSSTYTLSLHFENLTLTGTAGITGTGNSLNNGLRGNAGDNYLFGMDGDDILVGGRGDDHLFGGADYDIFVFSKGSGRDHVGDYNGNQDLLDLRGIAGLDSFADVLAHAKDTANGVVMNFGNGDVLTLDNVTLAGLTADHVMF